MLDKENNSLLHWAAAYNRPSIAESLLLHGCTVDMKDNYNAIPLHDAARMNNIDVARLLISYDVNTINTKDMYGSTSLHAAAGCNHKQMVELLLRQASIDVNARNEKGKMADDLTYEDTIKSIIREQRERTT